MDKQETSEDNPDHGAFMEGLLDDRPLIIVSNRGPVSFIESEDGSIQIQRNGGGLVTALLGLAQNINITWIASAINELDKNWGHGQLPLDDNGHKIHLHLVPIEQDVYDDYYNIISNPLLWFLQHSMWDWVTNPTITRETWDAWENGYKAVNLQFADVVAQHIRASSGQALVMIQDYHLYLLPRMLRGIMRQPRRSDQVTLSHFVHIPWPGAEELRILPPGMRKAILEGLTAVDVLGFQTLQDSNNFLKSVEEHLPGAYVNDKYRRIWYRNRATNVRDFPISIDVKGLRAFSETEEISQQRELLEKIAADKHVILRVDRTEPSKNIVRGFQAFDEMLTLHPEHHGKVVFIALLVPSRLEVEEYHDYHDKLMAAAGWVNSHHGTSEWEPIRVLTGENYARAIAGLQIYDVLLVNSIADGMNLVAKEGAIVNQKDGVLILSERTGASQQLESGAIIISPCDVYATAEALHQAFTMPADERQLRANRLRQQVEENDINAWLCDQIKDIIKMGY